METEDDPDERDESKGIRGHLPVTVKSCRRSSCAGRGEGAAALTSGSNAAAAPSSRSNSCRTGRAEEEGENHQEENSSRSSCLLMKEREMNIATLREEAEQRERRETQREKKSLSVINYVDHIFHFFLLSYSLSASARGSGTLRPSAPPRAMTVGSRRMRESSNSFSSPEREAGGQRIARL